MAGRTVLTGPLTVGELIDCIDREVAMRRRLYPRWTNATPPKITPKTAELELLKMAAVRGAILRAEALEQVLGEFTTETTPGLAERLEQVTADLAARYPVKP